MKKSESEQFRVLDVECPDCKKQVRVMLFSEKGENCDNCDAYCSLAKLNFSCYRCSNGHIFYKNNNCNGDYIVRKGVYEYPLNCE